MEIFMHMLRFSALAVFLLGGAYVAALADGSRTRRLPAAATGPATVFTFGQENADCAEWTNACQICTRDDHDAPQCSTPGIACTPGAMVCRVKKTAK
jgi:hypothetical protein